MLGTNKILALEHNFSQALLTLINSINPASFIDLQNKQKPEAISGNQEELETFAYRGCVVKNGIAYIRINGPILSDDDGWMYYYRTNIVTARMNIEKALKDDSVFAIVLVANSPGGEIVGVHELASFIYQARERKTIIAYAAGDFCSAMYWIGSACHSIVADPTALLGSIGVVMQFVDRSRQYAQNGIKVWGMESSQSPNKRVDPAKDPGKKLYQTMLNETADVFLNDTALFRGTTPEAIIKAGNYGFVRVGKAALEHGLCDAIGTLDDLETALNQTRDPQAVISRLNTISSSSHLMNASFSLNQSNDGEQSMELTEEQKQQLQAYAKRGFTLAEALKQMDLAADYSEAEQAELDKLFPKTEASEPSKNSQAEESALNRKLIDLAADIGAHKDTIEQLESGLKEQKADFEKQLKAQQTAFDAKLEAVENRLKIVEAGKGEAEEDVTGASSNKDDLKGCL